MYYIILALIAPEHNLFSFGRLSSISALFALFCFGSAIFGVLLFLLWTMKRSKYHPIVKNLDEYGPWRAVGSQVNLEFRALEKFCSVLGGTSIYLTDSWIIKCTGYKVYIVQQTDSHLSIMKSEDFLYNQESDQGAQFLQIRVSSIEPHERHFDLNVNAMEYKDMKDRLNAPIRNARDVVINQTLSDLFINAFREQVNVNGTLQISHLGNQVRFFGLHMLFYESSSICSVQNL